MRRFYHFQRNKIDPSLIFTSDNDSDVPLAVDLPLSETFFPLLFFTLGTLPFVLTSRGRGIYWKVCLISTPLTYLWMHFFPPRV